MRILLEMMRLVAYMATGAFVLAFVNVNFKVVADVNSEKAIELSYADLAAINLTVATVVLGAVALIVAVAAVFGFHVITSESVSNAEKRVKEDLPDLLSRELQAMENDGRLSGALERAIYSGGKAEDGRESDE